MPNFVSFGGLYQTTANFSMAALNLGSNADRMVLLGGPIGTGATLTSGSMSGGDAFSVVGGPTLSAANGSYNLIALAAAITAGGASQTGSFISTGGDGPLKWFNAISVDGATSVRSAAAVSNGSFGDPSATVSVQAGDLAVFTGSMVGVDRFFAAASTGGGAGTVKIDTGGTADFACYKVASSSGSLTLGGKFRDTSNTTDSAANWHGAVYVIAGAADTTAPNITSTGTGATNGPFAVNVAENSTAVAITLTSDEALSSVTKGGADGALFTLAGSGLTRTLAPTSGIEFDPLPHANPFVVTLTFADTATPTPNERTVTVNFTVTNVSEPPLAPTIGTAVAGNAQATVNGTPPVNTGRPAITGYRSTATPGGSTVTGASLPITHTGLTNGVPYTFTLAAQNADGFGPESAASNSVTPTAPAPGPTINTQPTNQTAKVGASATFTVAATSSGGALAYQWRLGGTPISGANSASYTRTGVALGDHGGAFTCAVTDSNGTTVSSAATLTVAVTFAGVVPDFTGTTGSSSSIDLSSYFSGGLSRTFAVLSGSMPTGLTQVGSTAVWTGTLGAAGSGSFVARATDSATNTDVTNTVNWVIGLTTPGTVTSSVLKNNDGWVFANVSGISCFARNPTTGADVLLKTGLSSNGSGVVSFADAALAQNTDYELRWKIPDPEQPTHGANGWEIVRST